jgi:uncharacterized protein YbjT (DUF2867 family)
MAWRAQMNILVTGGTGTVGSQVVQNLARTDHTVKVLTRDARKQSRLPAGVEAVEGNLLHVSTVRRVFDGFDAVFLVNTVSQTEATEALMAISGMRIAGVKRIVYLSVQDADRAAWLPHFGSKAGAEEGLRRSGIPFTILRPNNFYQNDYLFKDVILQHGVYPQPIGGTGISRVDVRDIAEAAAVSLTTSDHEGETYDLVGPELLTGESTARIWTEALGRPVRYGGDDLDAWEQQVLQFMPDWLVFDFKHMFRFFHEGGFQGSREAIERQTRLIGHAPRGFEGFARETAQAWGAAV